MLITVGQLRFRHQVLILLGSIILVVMLSMLAVAAPQLFESEKRTAFERLRSVSSLKALWLLREIEELESGLQTIAEDERLIDGIRFVHQLLPYVESRSPLFQQIAANDRGEDPLAGDKLSLYWQTIDRLTPSFGYLESSLPGAQLYIVRPNDGLISFSLNQNALLMAGLNESTETNSHLYQCYQRAIKQPRKVVFEDFKTSQGSNGLACAGTVMRYQGQILAVVLQEFPVSLFNNIMTMNTGLGKTGESYLVGNDKLLRTDSRHFGTGSLFDTFVDSRPVREGLAGYSGEADVLDYRREDVSAVWQAITTDNIRWSLVVKMDRHEIYQQLYQNVAALAAVWLVLLVLLIVIAIGFANRIERPLRSLLKNAQKIAGGDYSQLARRSGGARELSELFDMFNLMATEIHEHTDALDKSRQKAELASEEAKRATEAKSEFLSRMSHELRTPLNGVLGYAQLLRRDQSLNIEQKDTLEAIQNCGQHLLELINDVLDLSKIEAGELDVNLQPVDLAQVLQRVIDVVTPRADEKGLRFDRNLPKVDVTVSLDATKFRQVLINLLGNAVKFTQAGSVSLSVNINDGLHLIECTVSDTGPGIEQDHLNRIFQPFGQTDAGQDAGGAGLGLSISRQLCEAMGGEIRVDSELGQGTTFFFSIPLHIERREAVRLPDLHINEQLISSNETEVKALVVDDVAVNRDLLSKLLRSYGFDVYSANNGIEAVDLWQEHQFPLVLMDLRMPEMDGFEATAKIRALQGSEKVNICAVSANVQAGIADEALQAGFDRFIAKPVDVNQLLSFISECCGLSFIENTQTEESSEQETTPLDAKALAQFKQIEVAAGSGDFGEAKALLKELAVHIGDEHEHIVALNRLCDQFLMMDVAAYCAAIAVQE